jgi:hypothetical protein
VSADKIERKAFHCIAEALPTPPLFVSAERHDEREPEQIRVRTREVFPGCAAIRDIAGGKP